MHSFPPKKGGYLSFACAPPFFGNSITALRLLSLSAFNPLSSFLFQINGGPSYQVGEKRLTLKGELNQKGWRGENGVHVKERNTPTKKRRKLIVFSIKRTIRIIIITIKHHDLPF